MPDWVLSRRRQVGERIRSARRTAGLSQLELATRVGRDHRTVHRWQYATADPSLSDLLLLAAALGIPLPELMK
jgi:transcriptional regulator with XRE-family HTH domain